MVLTTSPYFKAFKHSVTYELSPNFLAWNLTAYIKQAPNAQYYTTISHNSNPCASAMPTANGSTFHD